jgi:hypothetical protein
MAGPLCNTPCSSDKSWLNEKNRSSTEGSKVRQNPKLGMKHHEKEVQFRWEKPVSPLFFMLCILLSSRLFISSPFWTKLATIFIYILALLTTYNQPPIYLLSILSWLNFYPLTQKIFFIDQNFIIWQNLYLFLVKPLRCDKTFHYYFY